MAAAAAARSATSGRAGVSAPDSRVAPFVAELAFVLLGAAVLLLGLAVIPAQVVPWIWASRTIEYHRGDIAFGALGLLLGLFAAAFVFLIQAR
jgi:hypothetical protein